MALGNFYFRRNNRSVPCLGLDFNIALTNLSNLFTFTCMSKERAKTLRGNMDKTCHHVCIKKL
jgi:hypothetical protein